MSDPLLRTKLFIPPPRPDLVPRPRLIARLNEGLTLGHKLTLVSAAAGFGKTTLVGEWIAGQGLPAAWLSLEEGDSEAARFLAYVVAAVQTVAPAVGVTVLEALQTPQPPPVQTLLATLLNEIATVPDHFVLVLDDYHVIDAKAVDETLATLIAHLPPQLHMVITTREDPPLPLARLRARGQMTELRAADLRFTTAEAAAFLNAAMGLELDAAQIAMLEARTEGWIAGLQMAALALQGTLARQESLTRAGRDAGQRAADTAAFVSAFSGSHRFVLDYLIEEVLAQQPERVQTFLLRTSILDRLCAPLCDAVLDDPAGSAQETLVYLERANLFVVPLDDERRWYRYHHLFADLLRQRLEQGAGLSGSHPEKDVAALHTRASIWYEANDLELDAFRHAVAAKDIQRAARLVAGGGMPLHFRGAMVPVLAWLASLPPAVLNARPGLWVTYASALTMVGHPIASIEEKLLAAEAALAATAQDAETDEEIRDLEGQIAAIRAMLSVPQNQVETIIAQARRALARLRPDNVPVRTAATWALGHAYQLQGNRTAARQAFSEIASISRSTGNIIFDIAATTGLGQIQEAENQLQLAAETYQRVLHLAGEPPLPVACEAYLGLTRISYQWNDLQAAQQYVERGKQLARLLENIDAPALADILLARLHLARGDGAAARATLTRAADFVRRHHFAHRMPDVAAVEILLLLRHGNLAAAAALAETHDLPLGRARVALAQEDPDAALALLTPLQQQADARGWLDQQLDVSLLQALAYQAQGETDRAVDRLGTALTLAEAGGFVRLFVDEGPPMAALLREAARRGLAPRYLRRLLAAFAAGEGESAMGQFLPDPLTDRELDVLKLLATELSGPEIARRLMISLNTMRTHTKNIYGKLGVNNRRTAVRRAQELDLL